MAVTSHDGSPPASVEREAEPEAAPEGTGDRLLLRAREALSEDMGMAVLQVGAKEEDPLEPKELPNRVCSCCGAARTMVKLGWAVTPPGMAEG